jgi:hypothetical protein
MSIIIGCAPSTGSSVLRHILNRHSEIYCGPETRLLSIPELYLNWSYSKKRIFRHGPLGVRPNAWHNITGVMATGKELYENLETVKNKIKRSSSFSVFIESYFKDLILKNNKRIWAEKTPNNIYTIQHFLDTFPLGKAIIPIRHPLEIICSQLSRGKSLFDAIAHVHLHLLLSLQYKSQANIYFLKYENLIQDSKKETNKLCHFLGIDFEENMLDSTDQSLVQGRTKIPGWTYMESDKIANELPLRFPVLSKHQQNMILEATQMMHLTTKTSLEEIALTFDYTWPEMASIEINRNKLYAQLFNEMIENKLFRLRKMQFKYLLNYPVKLNKA